MQYAETSQESWTQRTTLREARQFCMQVREESETASSTHSMRTSTTPNTNPQTHNGAGVESPIQSFDWLDSQSGRCRWSVSHPCTESRMISFSFSPHEYTCAHTTRRTLQKHALVPPFWHFFGRPSSAHQTDHIHQCSIGGQALVFALQSTAQIHSPLSTYPQGNFKGKLSNFIQWFNSKASSTGLIQRYSSRLLIRRFNS